MSKKTCAGCKAKFKDLLHVVVAHHDVDLCEKCYQAWFKARDKAVATAFEKFVEDK